MTNDPFEAWVAHYQPKPRIRLRLFCFPYAGGGASIFRGWDAALPEAVEVCPIQLPGRENRFGEAPFTRMQPLIETLAQVLAPRLDIPFALWGHSMGARIGFELARHLRSQDAPQPAQVFVSGTPAPPFWNAAPPIHALPEADFLGEMRRINAALTDVLQNAELIRLVLPSLRADFELCETHRYRPDAPLSCPITAYGGAQDTSPTVAQLLHWREQTCADFTSHILPGDHFFLHSAHRDLLRLLADELTQLLEQKETVSF
ncbi:MAG: thioesterase II family protein [Chloroflexota bacterium]